MRELSTLERAARLVEIATGERWGDGMLVTDVIVGCAEPGYYSSDDVVLVLGDWNPKRYPRGDDAPLTKAENIGPRLARALETAGAETLWLDEWRRCDGCQRAVRTEADSYSWRPSFTRVNECEILCRECLLEDVNGSLIAGDYINNADNAVTWTDGATLEQNGWTQYASNDPREYQNGWFAGQDDDPRDVLAEIQREDEDAEVVFLISDVGQFDLRFVAYTRDRDEDENPDEDA